MIYLTVFNPIQPMLSTTHFSCIKQQTPSRHKSGGNGGGTNDGGYIWVG
jgi:hypothetical protein